MRVFERQTLCRKPGFSNSVFGMAVALILALFVCLFILQVQKNPLRLDEVDYFGSMQNVVKLGLPIYYAGEVNVDDSLLIHLSTRRLGDQEFKFYRYKPETGILKETFFAITDVKSRYTFGLWHPPLYIYLGAIFLRLVPLTPDTSSWLRYFNLIFSLGVLGGMAALSRELDRENCRRVFLLALVFYTLNSLAVRGSVLIDYNATLGPCVAVWFVVAYLRCEQDRRVHWGVVFSTVLALFSSLGIAASLLLGVFVYSLIFAWRRRSWHPVASILIGTAIFLPVFLIFCRALSLPFTQPFLHNLGRTGAKPSPSWLLQLAQMTVEYSWIYSRQVGLAAMSLAVALFFRTLLARQAHAAPARSLVPIVIIVGFLSQASLGANAWGFMKYILFLLPLFFVYLAGEAVILIRVSTRRLQVAVVAALIIVALTSGISSFQVMRQPGGTLYNAREQGITEIAQAVRAISDPREVILSPKDVGFFAQRKFVQWSGARFDDAGFVRALIENEKIQYMVVNPGALDSNSSALASFLGTEFLVLNRSPSFVLLKKKS